MVPMAGVEPAQLSPLPPQDSVSTNSTTSAITCYSAGGKSDPEGTSDDESTGGKSLSTDVIL
jgi:hypothetical protein